MWSNLCMYGIISRAHVPLRQISVMADTVCLGSPSTEQCKQQQAEMREWLHNTARKNASKGICACMDPAPVTARY